jgi:SAM-dependent methyltransferase
MIRAAKLAPGMKVLDVACGTGEPTLPAARVVGPNGSVLGVDFVDDMVEYARTRARDQWIDNVKFEVMDGEAFELPAASFDAALIRWGLMFMPEPLACLRRVHASLRPGGRISVACWAELDRNPWVSVPQDALKQHVAVPATPPNAPGLFTFADRERFLATMREGGFVDATIEEVSFTMFGTFDSGAAWFDTAMEMTGPLAALYRGATYDVQQRIKADVVSEVERHRVGGKVGTVGTTWIASGSK